MSITNRSSTINRWAVLAGSVAVLLCIGVIYSFSVFAVPLTKAHGWSMAEVMLAFTINGAVAPVPMILGGLIVDRGWVRFSVLVGGLMFTAGFMLTGAADTLNQLYLSYGVLGGLGMGFSYAGCLSNTVKFFPDRRGMAAGMVTGGMGAGTVIGAPVAEWLIDDYGISTAFISMGAVYTMIVIVGALFVRAAPIGYRPPGWTPSSPSYGAVDIPWTGMLRTSTFYFIFVMMAIGAFSGLLIASQASPIGRNMFDLTAAAAAAFVGLYSACNALGRFVWGTISDRLGYTNAIILVYVVVALSMLVLASFHHLAAFVVGIVGLGLCFGGIMGVFPALVMKNFGPRFQGINYGIVFVAYSVAAYLAPKIAANISASHGGDYTLAFIVAIGLAIVGIIVARVFSRSQKARVASELGPRGAAESATL